MKSPEDAAPRSHAVPVWDPSFRYAPSKNIYAKKIAELQGRVYSDHDTESQSGNWRKLFGGGSDKNSKTELWLEIGCNAGHVVVEWAARNPNRVFLGLDWKFKPVFRGAEKAIKKRLENIIFLRAHAERVRYIFAKEELDRISIFFPDPWPKKKQLKNRWIVAERLRDLHACLREGGILHIKTDHPGYFDWIEAQVQETQLLWEIESHTRDLHRDNPRAKDLQIPDVTLFEKLFIEDGLPIHQYILKAKK